MPPPTPGRTPEASLLQQRRAARGLIAEFIVSAANASGCWQSHWQLSSAHFVLVLRDIQTFVQCVAGAQQTSTFHPPTSKNREIELCRERRWALTRLYTGATS